MVEGNKGINFLKGILYLSPALILMGIFTFYPLINTFTMAFKENYNYVKRTYDGIGFGNFSEIFSSSSDFLMYLINTLIIVFISVPASLILAIIISVSLNSIKGLQKTFQTIFFLPYVTNSMAIGMVFALMFDSNGSGLINSLLTTFGADGVAWIGKSTVSGFNPLFSIFTKSMIYDNYYFTAMVVLLLYIVWNSLPFKILILLGALQGIDKQYYQAAQIDGASKFKTFIKITVPFLSPQIFYLMITSFIGAFKEYNSIVALFGTASAPNSAVIPNTASTRDRMGTIVWYIYQKINDSVSTIGEAAAAAVILFAIILFFTAINGWVGKKRVHY